MASEIHWQNSPQFYSFPEVGWKNCEANLLFFLIEMPNVVKYTPCLPSLAMD